MEEGNQIPRCWPSTENVDQLKEILLLLPEMAEHPEFPFGKKEIFDLLAMQIVGIYEKYYLQGKAQ